MTREEQVGREAMQAFADYKNGLITIEQFMLRIQEKIIDTAD